MSTNAIERPKFSMQTQETPYQSDAGARSSDVQPEGDNKLSRLIEQRRQRPEVGAIWIKQAKTSNMEFLKIRLKLNKDQLQSLLEKTPDNATEQELPVYELVAFPNSSSNENNKRPAFRIYEAKE